MGYINFSEALQYAMNRLNCSCLEFKSSILVQLLHPGEPMAFSNINVTFLNLEADPSTAECFVWLP